jgi:DNA-directed RNA polymerase specialized sigma24 family protein
MPDEANVTEWLAGLLAADEDAAQKTWEMYYDRLIRLAQRNLGGLSRREADEEDIVLSAMHSFLRAAAAGRFPRLNDRDDLWKLLMTCTLRKVSKQRKRQLASKRGGGLTRGESAFINARSEGQRSGIGDIPAKHEPTPEFATEINETLEEMMDELPTDQLRKIASMKLEGFLNTEIASKLQVAEKTIQRKLARIRGRWSKRIDNNEISEPGSANEQV